MFWNENGSFSKEQPADDKDWLEGYEQYLKTIEDTNDERAKNNGRAIKKYD